MGFALGERVLDELSEVDPPKGTIGAQDERGVFAGGTEKQCRNGSKSARTTMY